MSDLIHSKDVDDKIISCLNPDSPKSFFLYAGAGSGKTRALVETLKKLKEEKFQRLRNNGQKIAIITYTNAARDEIKRRLEFDPIFVISTIHSFSWELIRIYQTDIKEWIETNTKLEIDELEEKQRKGRAGSKAASDRDAKIESKKKRLVNLNEIKSFSYNPNGINSGKDSLNHAEVIKITACFLLNKPLMKEIFVSKFPVLFIDESQDTQKDLMEAFLSIQSSESNKFLLGLFGDTMQRIFMDGMPSLNNVIPDTWEKPEKKINYRCPKRVITLINKIRATADGHIQEPSSKNEEGYVRLFIIDSNLGLNKKAVEKNIGERMSIITADDSWKALDSDVKVLILEHHMAARRGGFIDFFEPLYKSGSDSTGLLDGSMSGIPFLIKQLLPLIEERKSGNEFAVAQIVKKYSPLLHKKNLNNAKDKIKQIKTANDAVESLFSMWNDNPNTSLLKLIKKTIELNLFYVPSNFSIIANRSETEFEVENSVGDDDKLMDAWDEALKVPLSELEGYANYISGRSPFGTHQGVKGLEYPRVMVVLDDEEAQGFLFSYEKIFGAKKLTETDEKNIKDGKETSIDRTNRLFYVTCSRAEKSLAIVAYSKNIAAVKKFMISKGWFSEEEVIDDVS